MCFAHKKCTLQLLGLCIFSPCYIVCKVSKNKSYIVYVVWIIYIRISKNAFCKLKK